jgi:nucleoside-diphosphate-sugar epimerase
MKILVTGATSSIGIELITLLLEQGHFVRIISRQTTITGILQKTDIRTGDLNDLSPDALDEIDTVIHIAAATPGAGSTIESYYKTNVDGTRHLIVSCNEKKVRRFIHISSIVVLYKENTDPYSESKRQAEEIVMGSNLDWTILRPAEIIGADKSWSQFLQLVKNKNHVFVLGEGQQRRHPVFFRDVVKAIMLVLEKKNTIGKSYSLAAAAPVSYYQFLILVRRIFDCRYKIIKIPLWLIRILSVFKFILPGKLKRKLNNVTGMLRSIELDIRDAVSDFNYKPADLEGGLKSLKAEIDAKATK